METSVAGPSGAEVGAISALSDRKRPMEMEPDSVKDEGPWTPVQNRCKRCDDRTSPKTAPSTYSNNMARFKVVAPSPAEGYTRIVAFLDKNKELEVVAKPNFRNEWILSMRSAQAATTLRTTTDLNLVCFERQNCLIKAVVVGLPLAIPTSELCKIPNVSSADRFKKQGNPTQSVLCSFSGIVPEKVSLGAFGEYSTREYRPEPMRCYRWQGKPQGRENHCC